MIIKDLFSIIMNVGVSPGDSVKEIKSKHLVNLFDLVVFLYTFILGMSDLAGGDILLGGFVLIISFLFLINYFFLIFVKSINIITNNFIIIFSVLLIFLTITGGKNGSGLIWSVFFPVTAMQLKGHRCGTLFSALFLGIVIVLLLVLKDQPWMYDYSLVYGNTRLFFLRFILVHIALSILSFCFAINRYSLYKEIERLSLIDTLTDLPNRRNINSSIARVLKTFKRINYGSNSHGEKYVFSVILCDIDDFKKINDTYGHLHGDVVLKAVANLLKNSIREIDFVGRWGGEEFLIILERVGIKQTAAIGRKLRKIVSDFVIKLSNKSYVNITMSFGISCYKTEQDMETFISIVDKNLLKAKKAPGKNRVVVG